MRIGLFCDTYPPYINGVSVSTKMLKKALEDKGHIVYIVTVNSKKFGYEYDEKERILYVPGIPTKFYNFRLSSNYPIVAVYHIKKMHLDIIHSQQEFGIGTLAVAVSKQFGIPLVHTYHTEYEEYVKYISKGKCVKLTDKIVEYWSKFYCDDTVNELVVPTKKIYDLFKLKYRYDRNINIIPTGIDLDRFYQKYDVSLLRKKLNLENKFVILYLGRLGFEKNIDFLLKAQKEIKNSVLLIVGGGPELENYQKFIKDNKLNNVVFTDKIPWEDTPKYYQLADIFVTASKTETQGLTVIEAMASSKPVICIEDESFKIVVKDKINGRFFNTMEEYIDIINYLSKHPTTVKRYGKQAMLDSKDYSLDVFAAKMLKVYRKAIKQGTFLGKVKKRLGR